MRYPKVMLFSILIPFFLSSTVFSKILKIQCKGSKNFSIFIENKTCKIDNQNWELIEHSKKYLLCEISDPQLKIFEINLNKNEALYEDTDTDEMYELVCSEKI